MNKYYIAIADVHGDAASLSAKLIECDEWIRRMSLQPHEYQFVFLGDYIDRGADHEEVLAMVKSRVEDGAVCLIGNHEDMMLGTADGTSVKFVEANGSVRMEANGDLWQINDGVRTCMEMFGPLDQANAPEGRAVGTYGFHVADYAETIRKSWMYGFLKENGRRKYETRCVFFSHAPQSEKEVDDDTLLWGNRRDYRDSRGEAIFKVPGNSVVSVHGHMHMSSEKIYFPRTFNFVHGGRMRTVVMCDSGCGSHPKGELHPVVIRERASLVKGGLEYDAGVVAIL